MATRRLVTAMWLMLFGVLALGVGTAVTRSGDDGDSSPNAQPSSQQPFVTETPTDLPTTEPTDAPSESPSPEPTVEPTVAPTTGTGGTASPGTGGNGSGGGPNMPNTGLPTAYATYVLAASAGALVARRAVRG